MRRSRRLPCYKPFTVATGRQYGGPDPRRLAFHLTENSWSSANNDEFLRWHSAVVHLASHLRQIRSHRSLCPVKPMQPSLMTFEVTSTTGLLTTPPNCIPSLCSWTCNGPTGRWKWPKTWNSGLSELQIPNQELQTLREVPPLMPPQIPCRATRNISSRPE